MRTAVLLVVLSLVAISANAQIPVEVLNTSNDTVGQRLVYYLKEGIRTSSSMTLTFDERVRMQVMVVTLDQDSRNPGYSTAYSVVLVWKIPR